MYIFHNTKIDYLMKILKDGELKSKKATGYCGEGGDLYKTNDYVYFSTCKDLYDKRILSKITLFFNPKIIYNRVFWTNDTHTFNVAKTRKYPRYYKKYNSVLSQLYKKSVSMLPKGFSFQVFQQIAIKDHCKIKKDLVAIQFKKKPDAKIVKYINRHYPTVEIRC